MRSTFLRRVFVVLILVSMTMNPIVSYASSNTISLGYEMIDYGFNGLGELLNQAPIKGPNSFNLPQSTGAYRPQVAGPTGSDALSPPISPGQISMSISEGLLGLGDYPVKLPAGELQIDHRELELPGNGFPFTLDRNYSEEAEESGPFGKGWSTELGSYLTMYADFHIGEIHDDGTIITYDFVKDDSNAYVFSYDDDNKINYKLDKGHYEPAENGNVLKRISSEEYIVERSDGSVTKYKV